MTTSPNEPLESDGPRASDVAAEEQNQRDAALVEPESELAGGSGYDDRQESLEESDRDLFSRKRKDPDARYGEDDQPRSEPRKQPRQDS